MVIPRAEGEPRNIEFGLSVTGQIFACPSTSALARTAICLDGRRRSIKPDRVGKMSRKRGIPQGHRASLGFVALDERLRRLFFQYGGKLPADIDSIFNRRVVTHAAGRGEKVDGITTQ